MAIKKLSTQEFLDELNRNLKEHPGYEEWMQFVPPPDGVVPDTVEGFERAGPEPRHSLYDLVALKVGEAFEIFPK
ncbi:hypothetical protein GCM10007205_06200 [Oxalicibacterium flavum]|uniref:Uncharacterized protein n=1 Tax=Oxalicibacterium flavum TaxID=179467 RepID=A0A8J2XYM3_9BURK|nr:hypothetical protein [Oxalicibacterium flavum]GGB99624.1 hypothetical protein GCM10007205_06200 [Oxalicibacterium flavum]